MKKPIDPDETYVVKEFLACGEGHFLNYGYTHWEAGECCPHNHSSSASNRDVHLYFRKLMVPTTTDDGSDMIKDLHKPENRGKWGQFPVAPS